MSKERSPREVCSTTIGTSELWARPICISVLLSGKLQPVGCVRIAQLFGCTSEASMDHTVERELTVPDDVEDVWSSLAEPEWLGEDAAIDLREAGDVRAGERTGFVEEVDAPHRLVFWWSAPGGEGTRVEIDLEQLESSTSIRVIESRPLAILDGRDLAIELGGGTGPVALAGAMH